MPSKVIYYHHERHKDKKCRHCSISMKSIREQMIVSRQTNAKTTYYCLICAVKLSIVRKQNA